MSVRSLQAALEVTHYGRKHRGATFVVALSHGLSLGGLLLDFKLIEAFGLRVVLVAQDTPQTRQVVSAAQDEGLAFSLLTHASDATREIEGLLNTARVAVLLCDDDTDLAIRRKAGEYADGLRAKRLFLVSPLSEMPDFERQKPHLTQAEVDALSEATQSQFWAFAAAMTRSAISGLVALPARSGCLFEELFSHHGAGILIGDALVEAVRSATLRDAADIDLLLQAEVEAGFVRPVPPGGTARSSTDHLVYTIDDLIVATARLAPHGSWAELSRFATLPRYRGRGRARKLGGALIAHGHKLGYTDLFALSIDARMWRFFESLGFAAIKRQQLPRTWQENYDFSRPSRAFHLKLR